MIWSDVGHDCTPSTLSGTLHRLVESQQQVATSQLCDSLEEADLLEELLETQSKPPYRADTAHLHYLLRTPWRYPPLRYGSRFGSPLEPSLFYGSLDTDTCLAESAYYRLRFYVDMAEPPHKVESQHTLFDTRYHSPRGLTLQDPPFTPFAAALTHKTDYRACQQLGTDLRLAGIDAFEFTSARSTAGGINVALISPRALADTAPRHLTQWLCSTRATGVSFITQGQPRQLMSFDIGDFLVDGQLPQPA